MWVRSTQLKRLKYNTIRKVTHRLCGLSQRCVEFTKLVNVNPERCEVYP